MDNETGNLLIFGASARAAACSALRAGLRPWCADLFADADLCVHCPATRLSGRYPDGFLSLIDVAPAGPWMYTGGMENHLRVVAKMARRRPLWGNEPSALRVVRKPGAVVQILRSAGLPAPDIYSFGDKLPSSGRWLLKPRAGAGGAGIRFWQGERPTETGGRPSYYLQEFLEGPSGAAVFAAHGMTAQLLGVTQQLVGEPWLHARPFHYCGSIGPLALEPAQQRALERLGQILAHSASLRGLFGVDGIFRDGQFWPVEINPRYPASVEVLEHAGGLRALAWHRRAFASSAPVACLAGQATTCVGKAILFARQPLTFPADGPWRPVVERPWPIESLPPFADVPRARQEIEQGGPILTFFARAGSPAACKEDLQRIAGDLDRWLYRE